MKQLDVVFMDADKIGDLRQQFRELWNKEPLKLNAFIDTNQFALNDFKLIILGNNGNGFNIDVHNSIERKRYILTTTSLVIMEPSKICT